MTICNPISARDWYGADAETLAQAQRDRGFASGEWATAHQWQTLGESVIDGEAPERVYWLRRGESGQPGLRVYEVFAREQLAHAGREPDAEKSTLADMRRGVASLLTFLVRKGGLRDQGGDLRAMDAHRRRIGLVRIKGGMCLDYAREAAAEAGYLPGDSYISDLLTAINDELRGRKVYPYECAA